MRVSLAAQGSVGRFTADVTQPAWPALPRAVDSVLERLARHDDPIEQARQLGDLLARLAEQVDRVTSRRDAVLIQILETEQLSQRALAREFGLSHQRVSQLAAHARAGGRPPRRQAR